MKEAVIPAEAGIQSIITLMVFAVLVMTAIVPMAHALIIESPVEGQTLVVGEEFEWKVRPAHGEVCKSVAGGAPFNSTTGRYEWKDRVTPDQASGRELGQQSFMAMGEPMSRDGLCLDASVNVNVVLPATTVVTGIGASFNGDKKAFPSIARKPNGELVALGVFSEDKLYVSAFYSDDVMRDIADYPKIKYISANEKVAIVIPPDRVGTRPLVQATGPGKTDIVVQYGAFTDRVSVVVDECPYIEGKMELGCLR